MHDNDHFYGKRLEGRGVENGNGRDVKSLEIDGIDNHNKVVMKLVFTTSQQ